MTPNALAVLNKVIALFEQPDTWTVRYAARDANYYPVEVESFYATCWCTMGAVWKFVHQLPEAERHSVSSEVLQQIRKHVIGDAGGVNSDGISDWNDNCNNVNEVLKVLKEVRDAA